MANFAYTSQSSVDLAETGRHPFDPEIYDREGLTNEPASDSINVPWLLGLSLALGNAATSAISRNAIVFCEPEWGFESGGFNQNWTGAGGLGGPGGGLTVAW